MLVREEKQTKKSIGILASLAIHAVLIALLFLMLTKKSPHEMFADRVQSSLEQKTEPLKTQSLPLPEKEEPKKKEQKKPTLDQPFVVPAPVVFYGNQTMMNNPNPVSGTSEGKSAFEHTPSTLPTPATHTIAPERVPLVETQKIAEQATIQSSSKPHEIAERASEEIIPAPQALEPLPLNTAGTFLAAETPQDNSHSSFEKPAQDKPKELPQHQKKSQSRKLTLADLFKNAPQSIASFAQDGLPSAKKAGTEGGDDFGSGHQVTIKEGDMKYYTLWSKFLNHLNQSARFTRRGKEALIEKWITRREIRYILQCGITIDKSGKLLDIEIVVSSGCPDFDKMCLHDIRSAIPYPPLPESLGKKTARFEVNVYP